MLSIFSTFKEALFLAAKNFWFLVLVTMVARAPGIYQDVLGPSPRSHSQLVTLAALAETITRIIFEAMGTAAIMGLLKRPLTENRMWIPVLSSIKTYTWTLFRLSLLLLGIAIILMLPFGFLINLIGMAKIIGILMALTFLLFAKYALADPLVVVENMGAIAALRRSWEMTRGRFWYVGGCYLFLGGGLWLAGWILALPLHHSEASMIEPSLLIHFCFALADSLWIILAWCMYQRIKAADEPRAPSA